ncbi:MAG: type I 3-dehydroquinate dehydratase [Chthoniobacterales bacterium]
MIASVEELARALRLRRPPDFFELRLDCLVGQLDFVREQIADLRAPLIITARAPDEGGVARLTVAQRRRLLREFLPHAAYVDVELRSASRIHAAVLEHARRESVKRIISVHHFENIVSEEMMRGSLERAQIFAPDIFKIAVRTDLPAQCLQLLRFVERHGNTHPRIAAMGIGKLGRRSRIELARRGSGLIYAHLGTAIVAGQLSLSAARAILRTNRSVY